MAVDVEQAGIEEMIGFATTLAATVNEAYGGLDEVLVEFAAGHEPSMDCVWFLKGDSERCRRDLRVGVCLLLRGVCRLERAGAEDAVRLEACLSDQVRVLRASVVIAGGLFGRVVPDEVRIALGLDPAAGAEVNAA